MCFRIGRAPDTEIPAAGLNHLNEIGRGAWPALLSAGIHLFRRRITAKCQNVFQTESPQKIQIVSERGFGDAHAGQMSHGEKSSIARQILHQIQRWLAAGTARSARDRDESGRKFRQFIQNVSQPFTPQVCFGGEEFKGKTRFFGGKTLDNSHGVVWENR